MEQAPKIPENNEKSGSTWDGPVGAGNSEAIEGEPLKQMYEAAKEAATQELGSKLHDVWRAPRKLEDGSYEPREKQTSDAKWIEEHGTNIVDICKH